MIVSVCEIPSRPLVSRASQVVREIAVPNEEEIHLPTDIRHDFLLERIASSNDMVVF